jgi:hypothetical protein
MEPSSCSSNAHQGDSSGGSRDAGENSLTGKEAYVNHGISFSDIYYPYFCFSKIRISLH